MKKFDTHTVLGIVTFVVGLAVTNGLITNDDGKIVTGFASAAVALGVLLYGAFKHRTDTEAKTAADHLAAKVGAVPPAS